MKMSPTWNPRHAARALAALLMTASFTGSSLAAREGGTERGNPADLVAVQRDAMKPLAWMDGVWRGPAWTILPSGEKHDVMQTERIGPMLDGSIKVIEGRGYNADGTVGFNAFAIVSFDPAKKSYTLHSHAMGRAGDFELTPAAEGSGYTWDIPAGPMTIRYTASLRDGAWHEVGDQVMPGRDPVRFFEMNLTRVGDTDWPAAGAIPMK